MVLVAITYVDFLIFAQFAFLKRITSLGLAAQHMKLIMGAMALGGILFSLIVPVIHWPSLHFGLNASPMASQAFVQRGPVA